MENAIRDLARAVDIDVGYDHHFLTLCGRFEYGEEHHSSQGTSYVIDAQFIRGLLGAFRVERLRDVNGKACWITHTHDSILKIEPLFAKDGEPFDVAAWAEEAKARAALLKAGGMK